MINRVRSCGASTLCMRSRSAAEKCPDCTSLQRAAKTTVATHQSHSHIIERSPSSSCVHSYEAGLAAESSATSVLFGLGGLAIFCLPFRRRVLLRSPTHSSCLSGLNMPAKSRFTRLDAFTKTVEDARVRTTSGGIVTIVSLIIVLYLVWGEWSDYRRVIVHPELIVDKGRGRKTN